MRTYVLHAFGALTCLVLSVILALVVATSVPVVHGPVHLEKDYSEYSRDELRQVMREADHKASTGETSLLQFAHGRAIFGQALIWIIGLIIFKPIKITQFGIWPGALVIGWMVGVYATFQLFILGVLMIISYSFVLWRQGKLSQLNK